MARGFLVGSAALLMVAVLLSPAMAYTVCSYATSSYSIGTGTPNQYSIGSSGRQVYSIGSGTPHQYSIGSSGRQVYSIGSGTPYQYTVGSSALQPYSVGTGTPAASTGTCEVVESAVKEMPAVEGGLIDEIPDYLPTIMICGRLNKTASLQDKATLTPEGGLPTKVELSDVEGFEDGDCVCKYGSDYWIC